MGEKMKKRRERREVGRERNKERKKEENEWGVCGLFLTALTLSHLQKKISSKLLTKKN